MEKNYEEIVTQIIANSGFSRSCMLEAIDKAQQGHFEESDRLKKEANDYLNAAHQIQTELIQEEVRGNVTPPTLLMIHAQDHLMTAITIKELAEKLIFEIKARIDDGKKGECL